MISLSNIKTLASNSLGRTGFILSKHSPEIMLGAGVVGVVVGTVLACKATLKVSAITDEAKETLGVIKDVREKAEEKHEDGLYSDADYKRDLAITYIKTGVEIAKLYMPAIAVTGISVALIFGSHHILTKRNAAIAAAYELVNTSFNKYRDRIRNEYGDEAEQKLRFGEREVKIVKTNAKGKEKEVSKKILGTDDIAPFSFVFSEETATQYKRNWSSNYTLLRSFEQYANDRLNIRGNVILNEILDDLGLERTKPGIVMGWVRERKSVNDKEHYIDFGLDDPVNREKADPKEAMVQPWFLNFNVDGNVYNMM